MVDNTSILHNVRCHVLDPSVYNKPLPRRMKILHTKVVAGAVSW
ncbi:hypothetical protein SLEP1_g20105 [Rubroshorea leprosula]|uniref:Uncharacterized protein n=1 Tax=Rubroshorea leprosula TaxID=152421 RepID=A0AAV5J1K1_9ROSI|nr:hypothetical protein SLEP1_g20105 [Rubroshorea leprosula]